MAKGRQGRIDTPKSPAEEMAMVKRYLSRRDDIAFAYLFGSRAKGGPRPLSDIDNARIYT
jgi:predicted nucleotidyltransferase